jgi:hypothetical protein
MKYVNVIPSSAAPGQLVLKMPNAGTTMAVCSADDPVPNSYSIIPANKFEVRVGPDYAKNHKKEPRYVHILPHISTCSNYSNGSLVQHSGEAFYDVICADLFETSEPRYEVYNLGKTDTYSALLFYHAVATNSTTCLPSLLSQYT